VTRLALLQSDPQNRRLVWTERLPVVLGYPATERLVDIKLDTPEFTVDEASGTAAPLYVLPNGGGGGYARFDLDTASEAYLLGHLPEIPKPLTRGSAWVTLWDALLAGRIGPAAFIDVGIRALPLESDELNAQRILDYVDAAYWRYLPAAERGAIAPRLESAIRTSLQVSLTPSLKGAYFAAFRQVVVTTGGTEFLERVWRKQEIIAGLPFADDDYSAMAMELAVREVPAWREILQAQRQRIANPDRQARFTFVMPALSATPSERDAFFASLAHPENRRHEPWVLEALSYLHHPLRASSAEHYIRPSLEMLSEIRRTGDIFFPKRWIDATLNGHNSEAAAITVRAFLEEQKAYPTRLRQIILQSADELYRSSAIVAGHEPLEQEPGTGNQEPAQQKTRSPEPHE
jgi:aminopeptidase N